MVSAPVCIASRPLREKMTVALGRYDDACRRAENVAAVIASLGEPADPHLALRLMRLEDEAARELRELLALVRLSVAYERGHAMAERAS